MRDLSTRPARAALRPFRALRYDAQRVDLARVTSSPMDPGDAVAVAAALSSDPHNIAWLIDPLLTATAAPHEAEQVASRLASWRRGGILRHDRLPAVYVYGHRRPRGTLLGLIAAVSLHEPGEGVVVPHEEVSDAAVARHVALLEATSAQTEPVVMVHRGSAALRELLLATSITMPLVSFRDTVSEHHLWRVSDEAGLAAALEAIAEQPLLIADGHHRYAAFRRYRDAKQRREMAPWDFGLAMVVDAGDAELTLGAIHRVLPRAHWGLVHELAGVDRTPLPDQPAALSYLQDRRASTARCVITDGTTWLAVSPGTAGSARDADLAVDRLHRSWLPAWGPLGADVEHVHRFDDAVARGQRSGGLAVLLPAPPLQVVFDAASRGELLPPKATSFGPKPRIGLVLRHWPVGIDDLRATGVDAPIRVDAAGAGPG